MNPNAVEQRRAAFPMRLAAGLVDLMMVLLAGIALFTAAGLVDAEPRPGLPVVLLGLTTALVLVPGDGGRRGQTVGRVLLGTQVVQFNGRRLGWARALLRWAARFAPVAVALLVAPLGFLALLYLAADHLWPLLDGDGRALHDIAAGSRVVRVAHDPDEPWGGGLIARLVGRATSA